MDLSTISTVEILYELGQRILNLEKTLKNEKSPENNTNDKKSRCLTVKEAAEEFFNGTISESKLYDLIRRNEIPHNKISSGLILLDESSLKLWWGNKINQSVQPKDKDLNGLEEKCEGYGTLRKVKVR